MFGGRPIRNSRTISPSVPRAGRSSFFPHFLSGAQIDYVPTVRGWGFKDFKGGPTQEG